MVPQDEFAAPAFDLDQRLDDSMIYMKDSAHPCVPERLIDLQELVFKASIASRCGRGEIEIIDPYKAKLLAAESAAAAEEQENE